jgi:hypothetical protein
MAGREPWLACDIAMKRAEAGLLDQAKRNMQAGDDGYSETMVWRPSTNPWTRSDLEPYASLVVRDGSDVKVVFANHLETAALALFLNLDVRQGWTYWRGGVCPLSDKVDQREGVEYLLRSGRRSNSPGYIEGEWSHLAPLGWDGAGDIIAYRVVKLRMRQAFPLLKAEEV